MGKIRSIKFHGLAKICPTMRAADFWESARFISIFLASSFFCSQAESQPAQNPLTQTVGWIFKTMKNFWSRFIRVLAIIGITGFCCYSLSYPVVMNIAMDMKESIVYIIDNSYAIEPNTILDDIENGKNSIFTLQTINSIDKKEEVELADNWTQADFFLVAQELDKLIQQESLSDWHLNEMDFMTDCNNGSERLERATLKFYKTETYSSDSRIDLKFYIDPMLSQIDLYKMKSTPDLEKLEPINIQDFKFTAEEIIQIAEDNGGLEKREIMNNECSIWARVTGGGTYYKGFAYDGWVVSYISPSTNHDQSSEFYIKIDPRTGEYKIIDPEKGYPNLWQVLFPSAPE